MYGEIGAESTLGKGSTFHFTARFERAAERDRPRLAVPDGLKDMHALVVDDDPAARRVVGTLLESFSMVVTRVASGREALDTLLRDRSVDLVLLDWRMPGMDGPDTLRRMRAHLRLRRVPVLMMTAYGREDVLIAARDAGVDGILIKPVAQSLLFDAIMELFELAPARAGVVSTTGSLRVHRHERIAGAHLLLVEDNPVNRELGVEVLRDLGAVVDVAGDGEQAIAAIRAKAYDLVLMDVQMPVMNGLEATRLLRADPAFADLPIVAMTANAMHGDRERCLRAGMNAYVSKPIDTRVLARTIAAHLTAPGAATAGAADRLGAGPAPLLLDAAAWPGIDAASFAARDVGGNALLARLIVMFGDAHADDEATLRGAVASGDEALVDRMIHTIKGVAANIGATDLHAACVGLEAHTATATVDIDSPEFSAFFAALEVVLGTAALLRIATGR